MNLWYSIWESPHRWSLLAGMTFFAGLAVTIFMLAVGWDHTLDRVWLYLVLLATAALLVLAGRDWVRRTEAAIDAAPDQENQDVAPPAS
ncbi:MAG TPA: hypothetical protein VFB58_07740 [Chloroflexota bacterium]|nr:hypothetical protein [Chloroflexota bacterium]